MTASLFTYALSPFVALRLPWRYLTSLTCFPLYVSWNLLISLGADPISGFARARAASGKTREAQRRPVTATRSASIDSLASSAGANA